MDEWEAKYKILASGVADSKAVEKAERLFNDAKKLSLKNGLSLEYVVETMIHFAYKPEMLGFPLESAEWMPANKAMAFGNFGAVIIDLKTGKCKVASKEDLEKALRNVTNEHNI